jgi:hypothetical protein
LPCKLFSDISFSFSSCKVKSGALSLMFMGISLPRKSEFQAALQVFGKSAVAILILFTAFTVLSVGQEERPEIIPHRNVPLGDKKPTGKEPRALGILQLNGTKGTLVPVAILINGRFYDASAYKADPIPMALESGTVYEVEQAGDSQGFFTVDGALHSKTVENAHPWVGSGTYLPPGAQSEKSTRKAENVPIGLSDSGDEPPRLTRKESPKSDSKPSSPGTGAPADKTSGTGTASSQPANGSSASGPPGQETTKSQGPSTADKSGDAHSQQQTSPIPPTGQSSAPAASTQSPSSSPPSTQSSSGAGSDENYYRPTLRRGKPTTAPPPDDDEGTAKKTGKVAASSPQAAANSGSIKMMAAISDAAGPDPQSYKFFWKTGEEEERRNQMIALAQKEVGAYAIALVKNQIPAQTVSSKTAAAKSKPVKQAQPVLENVQFHGFDVWLNNQPVMILCAEAHFPDAASGTSMPESYSVTVVARTDIYGNLQKLYSAVTDRFHLDVTARLELIDVVDADGDGRGELLFRETTDAGKGYLIYRATADRLWKMFDSLNAE